MSNAELPRGGAAALRFDTAEELAYACPILTGPRINCAGGATPWGSCLSCEGYGRGLVWECDPLGIADAVARPAMGALSHEAAAVDPQTAWIYLTEDADDESLLLPLPAGRLRGSVRRRVVLEAAFADPDGQVSWTRVSPGRPSSGPAIASTAEMRTSMPGWAVPGAQRHATPNPKEQPVTIREAMIGLNELSGTTCPAGGR